MTQLARYIEQSGVRQHELAKAIGISKGHMSDLVNGKKTPSLKVATKIERQTNGAVTATSLANSEGEKSVHDDVAAMPTNIFGAENPSVVNDG